MKVDLINNHSILKRLALMQFVLVLILILISYRVMPNMIEIHDEGVIKNVIKGIIGFIILAFVHEMIHGLFFKIFKPNAKVKYGYTKGMLYASMPNEIFNRKQFVIILLAPFVLISMGLFIALLVFQVTSIIYIFAFHGAACIGDFYMSQLIYRHKMMKYVEDTEVGINLYSDYTNTASTT